MPTCTRPDSLPTISKVDCGIDIGQMVAIIFQRQQLAAPFATEAAAKLLAGYTTFLAASDRTKMVKSPEFANFVIPGTEAVYVGENSNESIGGTGRFAGYNAAKATGEFQSTPFDIIKQLKPFEDESTPGLTDGLTGIIVTLDGSLLFKKFDATGTGLGGIPLTNFNVADRQLDGFRAIDKNKFGFTLEPGWSLDLVRVKPSFNPRTLLNA